VCAFRNEKLAGVMFPMNNASGVGCVQRVSDLDPELRRSFVFRWRTGDAALKRQAPPITNPHGPCFRL